MQDGKRCREVGGGVLKREKRRRQCVGECGGAWVSAAALVGGMAEALRGERERDDRDEGNERWRRCARR
jgi:hypothetical protein